MSIRKSRHRKKSDSWQTIYMDLMTIIMVFFIILWSINQGKDVGISETIGDQTARLINLPGDVLFGAGQTKLADAGKDILARLFDENSGGVPLSFPNDGLTKRMLVIHGHTDGDGKKDDNLELGYRRALSAYGAIRQHSKKLPDHVVICTHADNTPAEKVPDLGGGLSASQRDMLRAAKSKNRRITIEDKRINQFEGE